MEKKKWTIGIVNFHTSYYLKWQLKILYEFNRPDDFQIIIVDNSHPNEKTDLEALKEQYSQQYKNIRIIYHNTLLPAGSPQHGEGLELILANADTDYLLVQDADFFWTRKNYLRLFEKEFKEGALVVGSPCRFGTFFGKPDFPDVYGCAYVRSELQSGDFMPELDQEIVKETNAKFIGRQFEESFDTGWLIRKRLSAKKYVPFSQTMVMELPILLGEYSWENYPCEYFLRGKNIGFHLFRGSTPVSMVELVEGEKKVLTTREDWLGVRHEFAQQFYQMAKSPLKSLVFKIKRIHTQVLHSICDSQTIPHPDRGLPFYIQNYHGPNLKNSVIKKIILLYVNIFKRNFLK